MICSSAARVAGWTTPRPIARLEYRRPVAAQRRTSAPATVLMPMPASCAHAGGAAEYRSSHARASADSNEAAVRRSTCGASTSSAGRGGRGEVEGEHGLRLRVLLARAELDDLGPGRDHRDVAGRRVVRVAALVDLV